MRTAWPTATVVALTWLFGQVPTAHALDPSRAVHHYAQRDLGTREGLPQGSVESLAQTPDGYLWLGTQEGLARFDGVRVRVYDRRTTPELRHNRVFALAVDPAGTLWIGSEGGGLARMRDGTFTAIAGLTTESIDSIACAGDGSVWATSQRRLVRVVDDTARLATAADGWTGEARALTIAPDGTLWLASADLRVAHRTPDGFRELAPPQADERARSLLVAQGGAVWLGTSHGLWRHDGAWSRVLTDEEIVELRTDRDGNLWAATATAGVLRRTQAGTWQRHDHTTGLGNDFIHDLLEDREGDLWIGTQDAGAQRLADPPFVTFSQRDGLPRDIVWPVLSSKTGEADALWFGTNAGGLVHHHAGIFKTRTRADGLRDDSVQALHEDPDGTLWIGTRDGTLHKLSNDTITVRLEPEDLGRAAISAISRDHDGALWLGQRGRGLSRLADDQLTRFTPADGFHGDSVFSIHPDRRGRLWVASAGQGLHVREHGGFRRYTTADGLAHDIVNVIHEDLASDDTLWIGTYGGGLSRWQSGRLTAISSRHGLFDDAVFQILDDTAGNLWISCNRGVYRVAKSELHAVADGRADRLTVTPFAEADGMRSRECNGANMPAGARTRDGRLWFPTVAGLAMIDPARVAPPAAPPPPRIETILLDGARTDAGPSLTLAPGSERLEIAYTAPGLRDPDRLRFRYMLAGFDRDWVDAGPDRVAHYTRLPPGSYEFKVAASAGGPWTEVTTPYAISQSPHLWETTWFRVGMALLGLAAIAGLMRLRLVQIRRRNRTLERLVAEKTETLRQAQERITDLIASSAEAGRDLTTWTTNHAIDLAAAIEAEALDVWRLSGDAFTPLSSGTGPPPPRSAVTGPGLHTIADHTIAGVVAPGGAVCGALVVRGKRRAWQDSERRLLVGFAHQLGGAIELERLTAELAEAQARRLRDRALLGGHALGVCPACGRCSADPTLPCAVDGHKLDVETLPPVIDERYRLTRRIGRGGMGQVFAADDLRLTREVALKVVATEHFSDPQTRARFDHEARIVAQIQHPGVVTVHDSGELSTGAGYLVMEILRGADLGRVLATFGRGRPDQIATLVRQGAAALAAAHARGIVHRDIKPGNIFLGADDRGLTVRLLDFGLAKSLQSDNALTRTGTLLGTPLYMSPEQVQSRGVGPRSDLYAFAAVCHEALVGERLVRASEFTAICLEVLQTEPPPPSQFLPDLDPRVDAAFAAALKKNPNDRPADLEAWAHDLADALLATRTDILGWPARLLTSDASGDAAAPTQSLAPHHAMEPTLERTGGFQ